MSSDAQSDICPKGWKIPTGGSSGDYQVLYNSYHSAAKMRASVANGGAAFNLAGSFSWPGDIYGNGTPFYQGGAVGFYSSTKHDSTEVYHIGITDDAVNQPNHMTRRYGRPIRCLLK